MTQLVNPSIDRIADSFLTAGSLAYAGLQQGGIVPSGQPTELAEQSAIDETVLNAFDFSTSSSSLDVTISPGEAFVFGSWVAKDTPTTVTLPGTSDLIPYNILLTWDKNNSNSVLIGRQAEFEEPAIGNEYLILGSFLTDENGVIGSGDNRKFVSLNAEKLDGSATSDIQPSVSDGGTIVVQDVEKIDFYDGFSPTDDKDGSATIFATELYTDSDTINAINNEISLTVNVTGDANSINGFDLVRDGNSGTNIINFISE